MAAAIPALGDAAGWTVPGLLQWRAARSAPAPALWQRSDAGLWQATTWGEYQQAVATLAAGLADLGLTPGERVGIMAANCKEWDYAQMAIMAAGGVAVGLDPYAPDEHVAAIASRCQLAGLIVGEGAQLARFTSAQREHLRFVLAIAPGAASDVVALETLLRRERAGETQNLARPDAPALIIFTSGTTGEPKGIEYTQRQVCTAAAAILASFPEVDGQTRQACWLPLSNLFQRMVNFASIGGAAQTYYVADPRELMQVIAAISPHVFIGIPRFFEKLAAGIDAGIAAKPAWQKALARWALAVGDRYASARRGELRIGAALRLQWVLANALVLSKLRSLLGANLRFTISGSAPLAPALLERFDAIGVPIFEAYGMSENIVPIATNRRDARRFGSVGRVVAGNEVRLADDGELLVRGAGVFSGYFGESAANSGIDADGFLHSGDFASIDADGFVTLIGRKAEIFKTSTGRRVAPASVEGVLARVAGVEQAFVCGSGRAQPLALLVVSEAAWQGGADALGRRLRSETQSALESLPHYLRPAALAVTARPFTISGGELTSNLKLRRAAIAARHGELIGELAARHDASAGTPFNAASGDGLALLISL